MRDTRAEQQQLNQLTDTMSQLETTKKLSNSVLAMMILCGYALTISTILWQWIG